MFLFGWERDLPIKDLPVLVFYWQTYEKVATVFKSEEHVVIANLDADRYRGLADK